MKKYALFLVFIFVFGFLMMSCNDTYNNPADKSYRGDYRIDVELPDTMYAGETYGVRWTQGKDKYAAVDMVGPDSVFDRGVFDRSRTETGCSLHVHRPYIGTILFVGGRHNGARDTVAYDVLVVETGIDIDTIVTDTTVIDTIVIDTTVVDTVVIDTTDIDTDIKIDVDAFKIKAPKHGIAGEKLSYFITETPIHTIDNDTVRVNWLYRWGMDSITVILKITDTLKFTPDSAGQCLVSAAVQTKKETVEIYRDSIPVYGIPSLRVIGIISDKNKYEFRLAAQTDRRRMVSAYFCIAENRRDTINTRDETRTVNITFAEGGPKNIRFWVADDLGTASPVVDTNIFVDFKRPVLAREELVRMALYRERDGGTIAVEIDTSVWLPKSGADNSMDTLLYIHGTGTPTSTGASSYIVKMRADKEVLQFNWYFNGSGNIDIITVDGTLALPWMIHGKVKVVCVDRDGVESLPDSFLVLPKLPPRPVFKTALVTVGGTEVHQYSWYYENCRKEDVERHSDFYGDSLVLVMVVAGLVGGGPIYFTRYFPTYADYANVGSSEKISENMVPPYSHSAHLNRSFNNCRTARMEMRNIKNQWIWSETRPDCGQ